MNKTPLLRLACMTALVASTTAQATSFNAFDPKSIAMGGAGVAIADPATAPFFNPALLSIAHQDDDFSIEFPVFGIRVSDENDFIDKIDGTDQLVDNVDIAIQQFNGSSLSNAPVGNMSTSITELNNKIFSLSDSPLAGSGGFGLVIAIPSESFGMAISVSGTGEGFGVFNYADADNQTVSGFTDDMNIISNCQTSNPGNNTNIASCIVTESIANNFQSISITQNGTDDVNIDFTTSDQLQSEGQFVGIGVAEVGFSISREFFIGSSNWAFGITPKAMSISIIDYRANVSSVEDAIDDIADVTTDYDDFNIDIGVAKDFENGWRAGLAIKNLISKEYESKAVNGIQNFSAKIEPQIRAGVSHQTDWTTVAFDLDVTENESLAAFDNSSTQYASLGMELNVWDVTQLRFGYRADLVNSGRNVLSAGIGFSPLGVHFDLGLAIGENDNEGAIAFQFGFRI